MLQRILQVLTGSSNEAADDLLLEALRLGNAVEQAVMLETLLRRGTTHGLRGVISLFPHLPQSLQLDIVSQTRKLHSALREAGRSDDPQLRAAAIRIIAESRQGMLAYIVADNLNHQDESVSRPAAEGMLRLAKWVRQETCRLQRRGPAPESAADLSAHAQLLRQRPEIETALVKAMELHRGRHGQELVQAVLLVCDHAGSAAMPVLQHARQGRTATVLRALQQPPAAEQIPAFLLAASRAGLRAHFPGAFSRISDSGVLAELLRHTHWLKDQSLRLAMSAVTRGRWLDDAEADQPGPGAAGECGWIAQWIGASGLDAVAQDQRFGRLYLRAGQELSSRLALLRVAMHRPRDGGPDDLIRSFLADPDERLARLAARELARRRPADLANVLLGAAPLAAPSVLRVITRAVAHGSFEQFWRRFDRLDRPTRRQTGRTMLKIVPDVAPRLRRRLLGGPVEQRLKAMQVTCDLDLIEPLRQTLEALCHHGNAKVRSRAISALGMAGARPAPPLLEAGLHDPDARVRANAIELLETRDGPEFSQLLIERTRAENNRERANAIMALHRQDAATAVAALQEMLVDRTAEHRISALWALRRIGAWQLIERVKQLAQRDPELRVRRYAVAMVRKATEELLAERRAG